MNSAEKTESPIVHHVTGIPQILVDPALSAVDPYEALDHLMAAVEALCPVWPERPSMKDNGKMLL